MSTENITHDDMRADAERAKALDAALPPAHHSTDVLHYCLTTKPDGNGSIVAQAQKVLCECEVYEATHTARALAEMRNKMPVLADHVLSLLAENERLRAGLTEAITYVRPTVRNQVLRATGHADDGALTRTESIERTRERLTALLAATEANRTEG